MIAIRHFHVVFNSGGQGKSISEDDPAAAGYRDWIMINTLPDNKGEFGYDACEGNGVHLYLYDHAGVADDLWWMIDLKWQMTLLRRPLWIDELGIGNGHSTDLQKMQAYIAIAEVLLSKHDAKQHPLGQRTEFLCPFISGGTPNGQWEPYFLLDDPAAYVELGRWMAS